MPARPLHECPYPGCRILLRERGPCPSHRTVQHERTDTLREQSHVRGYNHAWRRARLSFLAAHPLCAACEREGRVTPAEAVDHIVPHRGDTTLFWDRRNWQSLCLSHHGRKSQGEVVGRKPRQHKE